MEQKNNFISSAGTRGYSPLARVMTLAVMLIAMAATAWAANTVTWTTTQLGTLAGKTTATIDGVTITTTSAITESGGRATFNGATFSVEDGNITKIVLKSISGVSSYPAGWTIVNTDATWTGSAKSVSCGYSGGVYNIEFTIETVYTVTMAEGTVDATNWTISPTEAAEGAKVTATYSGTKHVKSVKAVKKAKPAATVATAPTATADVKAGSETALVSGGTATGGTMMYLVTTENKKPTSTEGFSATVPTAKTLAAGTFYVWYYVKADATHTDSEISATAVTVTVKAAGAPNGATIDDYQDGEFTW